MQEGLLLVLSEASLDGLDFESRDLEVLFVP